jgi:hypothetical protein
MRGKPAEQVMKDICRAASKPRGCVRGRFDHHAAKNLSSNMMANWDASGRENMLVAMSPKGLPAAPVRNKNRYG